MRKSSLIRPPPPSPSVVVRRQNSVGGLPSVSSGHKNNAQGARQTTSVNSVNSYSPQASQRYQRQVRTGATTGRRPSSFRPPRPRQPSAPISETKNAFQGKNYGKTAKALSAAGGSSSGRRCFRFDADPRFSPSLGENRNFRPPLPLRSSYSEEQQSIHKKTKGFQFVPGRRSQSSTEMVSQQNHPMPSASASKLSLIEQKQRQWAKEREELSGLWTPWGREQSKVVTQSHHFEDIPHQVSTSHQPTVTFGGNLVNYSQQSEHYLPPITDNVSHRHLPDPRRSQSLIPPTTAYANHPQNQQKQQSFFSSRKSSLQPSYQHSENESKVYHLQPTERQTTFHKEGNAEWMIVHTPKHGEMGGVNNENESGDRTAAVSPNSRVIVHKIYMDSTSEERTLISRGQGDGYFQHQHNNENEKISSSRPPPVAMRSSLNFGSRFGGSYEDIERKEREQWLYELDKQREEQRERKLIEKDGDKRARWGDRGVAVGHFWEASDSGASGARLPSREKSRGGEISSGSDTPPAWLQRSLQLQSQNQNLNISNSRSQPNLNNLNLYNGPLPSSSTQFLNMESSSINSNYNRSSIDISGRSRSPLPNQLQMNEGNVDGRSSPRSLLRGQNVPIDPIEQLERDRKAKANQEYLDEVKKQIEDKKRRQEEEKRKQDEEDKRHETIIQKQLELDRQRVEMERQKRAAKDSSSESTTTTTTTNTLIQRQDQAQHYEKIQIYESKPKSSTRRDNNIESEESPLNLHYVSPTNEPLPDAYELALLDRQSKSIIWPSTDSQSQSDPLEIPKVLVDQCLMTDSDHLYERVLTPKRYRSHSVESRLKDTQTQTEYSEGDTDTGPEQSKSKSKGKRAKSIGNLPLNENEKPRWGANPVKKVYLKQSEKDPNYQHKMRKKSMEIQQNPRTEIEMTRYEDEKLPFHRVQTRARSRKSPLKAFPRSRGKTDEESTTTDTSYKSNSRVSVKNNIKSRSKSPPKQIRGKHSQMSLRQSKSQSQIDQGDDDTTWANRHLGHISGLNSVGGSEESQSSGFASPSPHPLNSHAVGDFDDLSRPAHSASTTGDSNSLPSTSASEYVPVPIYGNYESQQQFDEKPIKAGRVEPGLAANYVSSIRPERSTLVRKNKEPVSTQSKHQTFNKPKPKARPRSRSMSNVQQNETEQQQIRSQSPPVPALMKKMEMGFNPDPDTGRLSSLPPHLLSPVPTIPIGVGVTDLDDSIHLAARQMTHDDVLSGDSRVSSSRSSEPKVDIDIAITPAYNAELQELLAKFDYSSMSNLSGRRQSLQISGRRESNEEFLKLPDIMSARSSNISRPMTTATDISIQAQEDFIRDLMSQKEVQEQLSARESELSEKGIIEFNIRLPANFVPGGGPLSGRSKDSLLNYKDPLFHPDKRRATAQWLHSLDSSEETEELTLSRRGSRALDNGGIFSNLSALKQGLRIQQHELVHLQKPTSATSDYD